ncbi:MAG TPA: UDP-2,4-diacetamido-2,4,6-trideoxy-beta-L-altropyranose hydrolase [Verrucomicrobiae bacterium]|nr:UDP-2,4-diacetamido-2,4,6-trideoxy-beta-L-altropyranose hydrolase [Verrucomicrobiae bacterium]
MNPPEPLLIRADASERIGTGHVMRMIALAQAYQDRGGAATILSIACPDAIVERVRREKIEFEKLAAEGLGSAIDARQTIARGESMDAKWVVLDGYHFGLEYQRALRKAGFKVLAVDDYGHCETWAADAVLNQNIFAPELDYRSEIEGCRFLLGTPFALLRREFRMEAENRRAAGDREGSIKAYQPIRRLLVTLGGSDPDNITGQLLAALNSLPELRLEIKTLVGGGNPHLEKLRQLAITSPHSIELLQNVVDMPSLYRWADGVISAGGSTCWEWMFYGLPAAVVCLADNQDPVVDALSKRRLALDLSRNGSLEAAVLPVRLKDWLTRPHQTSDAGSEPVVDAKGAERVVSLLDGSQVWLQRAAITDARLWFRWANDPAVRANGFSPDAIPWETHLEWFKSHQRSPDSRLWIGFNTEGQPLGYVRLHRRGGEWEIGVAVDPATRGKNIGRKLVRLALREFKSEDQTKASGCAIVARIKPENAPSLKLFQNLGFMSDQKRTTSDCCVLTCKLA